jgi:hypothetical protein
MLRCGWPWWTAERCCEAAGPWRFGRRPASPAATCGRAGRRGVSLSRRPLSPAAIVRPCGGAGSGLRVPLPPSAVPGRYLRPCGGAGSVLRVSLPPSALPGRYPAAVRGRRCGFAGSSPAVRFPGRYPAAVRGAAWCPPPPSAFPGRYLRPCGGAGSVLWTAERSCKVAGLGSSGGAPLSPAAICGRADAQVSRYACIISYLRKGCLSKYQMPESTSHVLPLHMCDTD